MSQKILGATIVIGGIIGAGILGIPYVVMKSGFAIGLVHLILLAIIICITMFYLAEITLRTNTTHQLPGYAEKYLGKKGKIIMFLAIAIGVYAAILAYLIGEGQSISYLLSGTPKYSFFSGLAIWLLVSLISYFDLEALKKVETIGVTLVVILITLITFLLWHTINLENLSKINLENKFIPFGVVLFAYLGYMIIPELKRVLKNPREMRASIGYAILGCFLLYTLFAFIVVGSQGSLTPQIATLALGKPFIILGIVTIFIAYLSLSICLIDTFKADFRIKKVKAWLLTSLIPLFLYILSYYTNNSNFTQILSIGGTISGGLTAILILLMLPIARKKGNRKPEFTFPYSKIVSAIIAILFILAAFLEII